jgi:hypothetical protein
VLPGHVEHRLGADAVAPFWKDALQPIRELADLVEAAQIQRTILFDGWDPLAECTTPEGLDMLNQWLRSIDAINACVGRLSSIYLTWYLREFAAD